eukprot:1984997-Prymnesium_polylepis.1
MAQCPPLAAAGGGGAAVPPSRDSPTPEAGSPGGGRRALSGIQGRHATGRPVASSTGLALACTTVKG